MTHRTTHGESSNKNRVVEYSAWFAMKQRCNNPKSKSYKDYGARGIGICKRWMKYENFLADMGRKPSLKHSLDRINNSKNYSKSNCRWATYEQQLNNTTRNILFLHKGKKLSLSQISRLEGVSRCSLNHFTRTIGLPLNEAIQNAVKATPKPLVIRKN